MKLNVPNKLLQVNVSNQTGTERFPYQNGSGDKWWVNGSSPKFYRWRLTLSVSVQPHGSHLTREPFEYNGLDVFVGDWIGKTANGKALKIISVESKAESSVVVIAEDVLRYNTFRDENGDGAIGFGSAIIFRVTEDNIPLVDPVPTSGVGSTFLGNLQSRFESFNERNIFELEQESHSFIKDDLVSLDSNGDFIVANSDSFDKLVGSVVDVGPGPNKFLIKPFNEIHEQITPVLPGNKGDLIYVDNAGEYTTSRTPKPVYLQLSNSVPTIIEGSVVNPTTTAGNELNINDVTIVFSSTSLASAVSDINNETTNTGVVADDKTLDTTAQSGTAGSLIYGVIGSENTSQNPIAEINGTSVSFTTTTDGSTRFGAGFASGIDFAEDINNAGIANIEAVAADDNSSLTIFETSGGSISITNIQNDSNNTPWAGAGSSTALPLSTSASTDEILTLTRADGGEIKLENSNGDPKSDFGIESAQNGRLPFGLVIEQGIRKGDVYVVSDLSARNALSPLVGDMAYVIDSGQNEWTMYIWDGTEWTQLVDQDASNVDAQTLSVIVDYDSSSPLVVGRLSDGSRVTWVSVEILTVWDSANPSIEVGDNIQSDRFMPQTLNDLTEVDTYAFNPSFQYDTGGVETEVLVFLNSDGASQGQARVTITYT